MKRGDLGRILAVVAVGSLMTVGGEAAQMTKENPHTAQRAAVTAPRSPSVVLYDQTNNGSGNGAPDQDFESAYDAYDCQAADDFVVPALTSWSITRVNTIGTGGGITAGVPVNVVFHNNAGGLPGAPVCSYPLLPATAAPSMVLNLPAPCVLGPGTYWLDLQVRADFASSGQHFWSNRTVQSNNPGVWQNPGDGFATGCTTWTAQTTCGVGGGVSPDFLYSIEGTAGPSFVKGDFSSPADGNTDLLFRHQNSGNNVAWFMDGITRLAGTFLNPSSLADNNWRMVGTHDFSTPQDGKTDILFRHGLSGKMVVWYMDGITRTLGVFTNPDTLADTNWGVVGTGDFSTPPDNKPDILFRHGITGNNVVWYMDGITRTAGVFTSPAALADTNWFMVGIGDFWSAGSPGAQDGKNDILWRHNFSGKNVLWYMDGITRTAGVFTSPSQLPDTNWRMVAVGDYSTPNDNRPDIVFRHQVSGNNVVWYMIGATRTGGVFTNPAQLADTYWKIVGPR